MAVYQEAASVLELSPLRIYDILIEKFFISLQPILNIKKVFLRSLSPRINSQHKVRFHLRPKNVFHEVVGTSCKNAFGAKYFH